MAPMLPPLRLTGALCLRDGTLQQRSIALAEGRFTTGPYPAVDLRGHYVLPGIIDLHAEPVDWSGDGVVARFDRAAAAQGVTTRRITVPWSWESAGRGPVAAQGFVAAFGAAQCHVLTDLHLSLACEAVLASEETALLTLIRAARVPQVIFTNRADHLDQLRSHDPAGFLRWAWTHGVTADALSAALDAVQANAAAVPRHLCRLAECFDDLGVLYGSDGDVTAEMREHHSMIGARLCVNPGTARVAAAARAVGDPVLVSAGPEFDIGSAAAVPRPTALVQAGLCDALVSGRDPDGIVPMVFRLVDRGVMPLERAWRLVSDLPARIARMPDRGIITPGKRADVTIIDTDTRRVAATIAGGRLSYATGPIAERFLPLINADTLAAE